MAPPLFDVPRLIPCPNCSVHIKRSDSVCRHCGATLGPRGSTLAPLLVPVGMAVGLLLSGCGDDSGNGDAAGSATSGVMTGNGTGMGMDVGESMAGDEPGMVDTFAEDDAYGVPDTGIFDDTSGDTVGPGSSGTGSGTAGSSGGSDSGTGGSSGTDTGGTTGDGSSSTGADVGEPDYGVPNH